MVAPPEGQSVAELFSRTFRIEGEKYTLMNCVLLVSVLASLNELNGVKKKKPKKTTISLQPSNSRHRKSLLPLADVALLDDKRTKFEVGFSSRRFCTERLKR